MTDWILTEFDEELHNRTLRKEARKEALEKVSALYLKLEQDKRLDELERAVQDSDYLEKLLEQYGLVWGD